VADKDKKYYWLKLKRDFFKRHDIQIIEDMPNGKDYILFYLKLLCESVDHDGNLRFSEEIPYNEQMLATITRTNVDIVRSAVKVFESLKMIEVFDDGTYYMNEVQKMLGSETYWAEQKRLQRQKKTLIGQSPTCPSKSIEIEKDIDIEKEKSIKKKTASRFHAPTLEEIQAYCDERNNGIDAERFLDYYTANGWVQGKGKPIKDWKATVRTWEKRDNEKPAKKPKSDGSEYADLT
jgi:predicted phage replisome organizer